jgi:8-oxo-dGTP diphosphatase
VSDLVRAAGGAVVRRGESGELELAVVHRPKYGDWTLPKGKLDRDERFEDTALREVEEETGLRCGLGPELGSSEYRDSRGRPKLARYWLMAPVSGRFEPNQEVDELRWLSLADAAELLTYERDRELAASIELERAEALLR